METIKPCGNGSYSAAGHGNPAECAAKTAGFNRVNRTRSHRSHATQDCSYIIPAGAGDLLHFLLCQFSHTVDLLSSVPDLFWQHQV